MPARSRSRFSRSSTTCCPVEGRALDALLGERRRRKETRHSSSACPARGRRRCRAIRSGGCSVTTSTGGAITGVFNFEGGCYAKVIKLSAGGRAADLRNDAPIRDDSRERRHGSRDACSGSDDASLTENTRGSYPLHFIDNAILTGQAGHPRNIVMLTADAYGVLPPIARLTPERAMYHFLSGYTARVAGTEKGVTEPKAVFSTCFGAPFLPLPPTSTPRCSVRRSHSTTHGLAGEHGMDGRSVRRGHAG